LILIRRDVLFSSIIIRSIHVDFIDPADLHSVAFSVCRFELSFDFLFNTLTSVRMCQDYTSTFQIPRDKEVSIFVVHIFSSVDL